MGAAAAGGPCREETARQVHRVKARASGALSAPWKSALLWAFPLVVASFLAETIISQLVATAIDDAAKRIVTDYSPSIVALATARSELHRIQDLASDYVDGGGRRVDRESVEAAESALDRAAADYLRLPFIAGERELWERVADDIRVFRQTIDRTFAAVARGDQDGARTLVRLDLRAAVDRASADLLSDIELNGNAADDDARLIARHRKRSLQAAIGLASASVGFTVIMAMLVYRLGVRHDALLRRNAELLEEENAELEIFASRLSHDILSPLATTRLALDAALGAARDAGVQRTLQRGAGALDRVSRIARALFEFARSGARPDPTERGDVRAVVGEVLDEYRSLADETDTALAAAVGVDAVVACNEGLLTAALSNLVRNAITHMNGAASRRVDILVADAGPRVRVEVRDTGPGLPPGTEATVFEPFVRGQSAQAAGLGLGLATVKRIVETHGGAVGVESRPGTGSRFWLELPRARA
jgi:signal transduction histidine kinase